MLGYILLKVSNSSVIKLNVVLLEDFLIDIPARNTNPEKTGCLRKQLINVFKDHGLNISIITNAKVINFLYTTFDLTRRVYMPYNKELNKHIYISKESN